MKKIIGLVVLLVIAAGGYYTWLEMQKTVDTDDAQIDGDIVAISSRVPGYVTEVLVADQQYVHKGDVLVRLDSKDFAVQMDRVKADIGDALATLETSQVNVPLTAATTGSSLNAARSSRQDAAAGVTYAEKQMSVDQARLATAQANVKVAEANASRAAQDVDRYKMLVAKDQISKQQYDQAASVSEAAKATVEAHKSAVNEAQQSIAAAEVGVAQARARLSHADAEVEGAMTGPQQVALTQTHVKAGLAKVQQHRVTLRQAELNLQYTTIVAPLDGIVGRKSINVGQNVAAGQQMMAIVPMDNLWVTANFKETQLKQMKEGMAVKLAVDANGLEYTGKIERIAGASGAKFSLLPPENATGNYVKVVQRIPVRISIDPDQNKDHVLRPGMSVVPSVRVQ